MSDIPLPETLGAAALQAFLEDSHENGSDSESLAAILEAFPLPKDVAFIFLSLTSQMTRRMSTARWRLGDTAPPAPEDSSALAANREVSDLFGDSLRSWSGSSQLQTPEKSATIVAWSALAQISACPENPLFAEIKRGLKSAAAGQGWQARIKLSFVHCEPTVMEIPDNMLVEPHELDPDIHPLIRTHSLHFEYAGAQAEAELSPYELQPLYFNDLILEGPEAVARAAPQLVCQAAVLAANPEACSGPGGNTFHPSNLVWQSAMLVLEEDGWDQARDYTVELNDRLQTALMQEMLQVLEQPPQFSAGDADHVSPGL